MRTNQNLHLFLTNNVIGDLPKEDGALLFKLHTDLALLELCETEGDRLVEAKEVYHTTGVSDSHIEFTNPPQHARAAGAPNTPGTSEHKACHFALPSIHHTIALTRSHRLQEF